MNTTTHTDMLNQYSFSNIKKEFFGYNKDEVNNKARMLYGYYSALLNSFEELQQTYDTMLQTLQDKTLENYELQKENTQLKEQISQLSETVNTTPIIEHKPSIKQFTDDELKNQSIKVVNNTEEVFIGEVEDTKSKVSEKFRLDTEDNYGSDMTFL